jgi:hypothetical protein
VTSEVSDPLNEVAALRAGQKKKLIAICVELMTLCVRLIGEKNRTAGTMIAFVRDEILSSAFGIRV